MDLHDERDDPDEYLPDFDGGLDRLLPTMGEATIAAWSFARSLGQLPRRIAGGAL